MPDVVKKAKLFGMTTRGYLGFLFIHGCLHLEGMDHGRTMEALEGKFCRAFHFPTPE
jgi:ssRNA-specific RNase YbeY (16S rRNA maturation enzyme)